MNGRIFTFHCRLWPSALECHPGCIGEIFNQGRQSWMPWGGLCGGIEFDLVFLPGKAMLDSAAYAAAAMEPHLVPLCCEEYGWAAVVGDGAPGHRGHSKNYRDLNGMDVPPWPRQSADLDLWGDTEVELGQVWGRVRNVETLAAAVKVIQDTASEKRLEELVRSMPAAIDVDGYPTLACKISP